MATTFYIKRILFLVLATCVTGWALGQNDLQQRLTGKTKLKEIMAVVEDYFKNEKNDIRPTGDNEEEEFENDYLRWKRWEYYMQNRLDEQGNIIPNTGRKVYEAMKNYEASLPNSPQTSYSIWTPFGPTSVVRYGTGYNSGYGRVNCIAFHPTQASTMIIGTPQGGIWKTTNNGTSWFNISNNLPSNAIGGLVWDRTNANIIYALTGDGDGNSPGFVVSYGYNIPALGVFKSTDGGISWDTTGTFPGTGGNFYGYKLIQHPTNPNTIFAVTTNGIYRTVNGGVNWTWQQTGSFTDIEFKPGNATIMYAAQLNSISPFWRSTDGGDNWTNTGFTGVPGNAARIAIGVSANQPDYIYLLGAGATGFGSFVGLYRSTTSGTPSFSLRTNTPNILGYPNNGSDNKSQARYDLNILIDPNNASNVITSGINIWQSVDGGASFDSARTKWYDDVPGLPSYVHADVHDLAYNPLSSNMYSTSDGGVGFSTNSGSTWTFASGNLQILASYHADFYEADASFLACGSQDNGENLRQTSGVYRHINGADGFDCVVKDDNKDTIVYIANSNVLKTVDGGLTKTDVTPGAGGTMLGFCLLARDYNANQTIYLGDVDGVYRSVNFGSGFPISRMAPSGRVLTTCPSSSNIVYTSDGTTLMRCDNATTSFTFNATISGTTGYPTGANITDLEVRPSDALYAYACFGGYASGKKVYYTINGGTSWNQFSGNLPNVACHSIAVDASNTVYVGTDIGVFVRTSAMTDWQPFYNYLPRTPVSELLVNNTGGKIIACTFGSGNYISDLFSACAPNLTISGNISGRQFFEASSTVNTTATVLQGQGNSLALKSGGYVQFNPGFDSKAGGTINASVGSCGSGGIPLTIKTNSDILNTELLYVPAKNNQRFADARITGIIGERTGMINIVITNGGIYTVRLTDRSGSKIGILVDHQQIPAGTLSLPYDLQQIGSYYVQLFRENELVSFQQLIIR